MQPPKRILLKLTGSILSDRSTGKLDSTAMLHVIDQIKRLKNSHQFGIVIGGGSFFRGNTHGKRLGLMPWTGHTIGMLATVMNGLILKDLMTQAGIATTLLSAVDCPGVAPSINQRSVTEALAAAACIIFAGGTGMPYFTTDTNAIVRCLQMEATEVWKCTDVDGVYDSNPTINPQAQLVNQLTIRQALERHLDIMDMTAFTMAQELRVSIRILNIFKTDSLIRAAEDPHFGSLIHP